MEPYFTYVTQVIVETKDWRVKEALMLILDALSYRIMDNK